MRRELLVVAVAVCVSVVGALGANAAEQAGEGKAPAYKISGPYTHGNLSIYLIHGEDRLKGKKFVTLQEALEKKIGVVDETGNVNNLSVENVSGDVYIYIHSGDIVKGGKQDRMISQDMVIPPQSGKKPLSAFCVESGRWRARGSERVESFTSSSAMVAGKDLKLAAKLKGNQGEVWQKVSENQDKLAKSVKVEVRGAQSQSSFQLTLENPKVKESAEQYVKALSAVVDGKDDVLGFAFAINGKLNSADVYASGELFRKFWPKLLQSSAVEAVAETQEGKKFDAPKPGDVGKFLAEAKEGKATRQKLDEKNTVIKREGKACASFDTMLEGEEESVHDNCIVY